MDKDTISVTPVRVNTRLEDLRASVDNRAGIGGQGRHTKIYARGHHCTACDRLSSGARDDARRAEGELDAHAIRHVSGMEVTPVLVQRAPRYVFVVGEVKTTQAVIRWKGRRRSCKQLPWPTGLESWSERESGCHIHRAEDWRLIATMVDVPAGISSATVPWRRNLDRHRPDHRSEIEDPAVRRLREPGVHTWHLRCRAAHVQSLLDEPLDTHKLVRLSRFVHGGASRLCQCQLMRPDVGHERCEQEHRTAPKSRAW